MNFDASLVVLIGFTAFMVLAGRKIYAKVIVELDQKIKEIRDSLNLSENELLVAEQLNKEEHKRQATVEGDIKIILEKTNRESARLKRKMIEEIEELTQARHVAFEDMLVRMRLQSMQQLRNTVSDATAKSLESLAMTKVTQKQHEAINDKAIELIAAEISDSPHEAGNSNTPSRKASGATVV